MKRIAFLGRGVHTLHSYRAVTNNLAAKYAVSVFTETRVDPEWKSFEHKYRLVEAAWRGLSIRFNGIVLFLTLVAHHVRKRFNLIHCHSTFPTGFVGVVFSRIFRVPVIVSLDGGEGISIEGVDFGDLASKRRSKLNKWVIENATEVTVLTDFHRSLVVRNLGISRTLRVLTRGIDVDMFKLRNDSIVPDRLKRLLFVGYLSPVKNPELLIEVFTSLQSRIPCTLTVVGKDYMHGKIQQLVQRKGLSHLVKFVAQVSYGEMPLLYQDGEVLLVTSKYESQGVAVVEAMASGVVVCGNPVGLLSDLPDNLCVKIKTDDPEEFAQQVFSALMDEEKIRMMRRHARAWCEEHDIKRTVAELSEVYERLFR